MTTTTRASTRDLKLETPVKVLKIVFMCACVRLSKEQVFFQS